MWLEPVCALIGGVCLQKVFVSGDSLSFFGTCRLMHYSLAYKEHFFPFLLSLLKIVSQNNTVHFSL